MSDDPKICSGYWSTRSLGLSRDGVQELLQAIPPDNEKCGHTIVKVGLGGQVLLKHL